MLRNKSPQNSSGFTLIEVILYVGLSAFVIAMLIGIFALMIRSRAESQARQEITEQAQYVNQVLTRIIRNTDSVILPAQGNSDSQLQVTPYELADDPIIITVNNGILEVSRGGGGAVALTSERLSVNNFTIENFSESGTSGVISFSYTLSFNNPSGITELNISEDYYGSAAVR